MQTVWTGQLLGAAFGLVVLISPFAALVATLLGTVACVAFSLRLLRQIKTAKS